MEKLLFANEIKADLQTYIDLVRTRLDRFSEEKGRAPMAYTRHFGCQQNVADGEKLDGLLLEMGYTLCQSPDEADFILYNTCAVREGAEDRVFGNVGALKRRKQANPDLIIALCGCMMQQEHVARKIRASYPHVDLLFGANAMHRLPPMLYQKLSGSKRVFDLAQNEAIVEDLPTRREGGVKAWLPIMHGCNNFCTYCVVPLVRGREQSRSPERVLAEARELVARGYREITLLGQNVNSYGKGAGQGAEETGGIDFSRLLREINEIPGDFQIRFMTSHPKDCTTRLLDTIRDCEKVCNHLHLPVQSGSDRILKAMNRGYTSGRYLELIAYAKEQIPGITFTSDIIVGFPGEQEADFEQTLELVERVGYQSLFTFLYSRREGTKAAGMEDPVPKEEKMRWFNRLLEAQNKKALAHNRALVGKTLRVLVDDAAREGKGRLTGRTESNIIVKFPGPGELEGSFVPVTITGAQQAALEGEPVE